MKDLGHILYLVFLIVFFILLSWFYWPPSYPQDDCDDAVNHKACGFDVYTDHKTGKQYLVTQGLFGPSTVTPR